MLHCTYLRLPFLKIVVAVVVSFALKTFASAEVLVVVVVVVVAVVEAAAVVVAVVAVAPAAVAAVGAVPSASDSKVTVLDPVLLYQACLHLQTNLVLPGRELIHFA